MRVKNDVLTVTRGREKEQRKNDRSHNVKCDRFKYTKK